MSISKKDKNTIVYKWFKSSENYKILGDLNKKITSTIEDFCERCLTIEELSFLNWVREDPSRKDYLKTQLTPINALSLFNYYGLPIKNIETLKNNRYYDSMKSRVSFMDDQDFYEIRQELYTFNVKSGLPVLITEGSMELFKGFQKLIFKTEYEELKSLVTKYWSHLGQAYLNLRSLSEVLLDKDCRIDLLERHFPELLNYDK